MNYKEFNQFCASLPATTYVVQWRNSHVWKVGGKVFAIGGWGKDKRPAFTFKTSAQNYYFLRECGGYIPAPYFANRGMKWIQHIDSDDNKDQDLQYYLTQSHRLVSLGLTKLKQKQLGLNQVSD